LRFLLMLAKHSSGMPDRPENHEPTLENRWWVDTDKRTERARPRTGDPAPVGSRFFDIGYEFDQERAKIRLTDSNLKLLDEARPAAGAWGMLHMVPQEAVPDADVERIRRVLPLPPHARGVVVDSGRSIRFIVTGDPVGERVLEFTLGGECSFDCWIRGEWVREELFAGLDDALERAPVFLEHYLTTLRPTW
jgi:hypothetical protein